MAITKTLWGYHEAQELYLITITNGWMTISVTNFGCSLVAVTIPGHKESETNIVLGYDSPEGYVNDPYYVGCIVGRFANRIAQAGFNIGETSYHLEANETGTGNHLHGGNRGFNKKIFSISDRLSETDDNTIRFYYRSRDGEEGYPGNLDVYITYRLTDDNELIISYEATADRATPVNLTSHSYFNLSGSPKDATPQEVFIDADSILIADGNYIPTGDLQPVKGTNFDFTKWRRINASGNAGPRGYNECFVLNNPGNNLNIKAGLRDHESGITMLIKTSLPGIILYTGDYLGTPFIKNQGICLETQFYPDSPNHANFPSTLLSPGDVYQHETAYRFFIN